MRPEIRLEVDRLTPHTADVQWDSLSPLSNVRIRVDIDKDGRIKCVLHELIHIVFYALFTPLIDAALEEEVVLAWETLLYNHVRANPRRLLGWRLAIEKKLAQAGSDDDED